jgi:hypothetical protein
MADLAPNTVAERLRDGDTRSATLVAALESHPAPVPTAVSLAAAPALVGLMAMDAAEVEISGRLRQFWAVRLAP